MIRIRKIIIVTALFLFYLPECTAFWQQDTIYNKFIIFTTSYKAGDFGKAEKYMLSVLESGTVLPREYVIAAYNNLGLIKKSLGFYQEALEYYNKAEGLIPEGNENQMNLAFIYNNKSRIYTFMRSYSTAKEYLEKSIRIFNSLSDKEKSVLSSLSTAYLNLGIIYYELADYESALKNLEISSRLKEENDLPETELTYLNLAKTYSRIGDTGKAEKYYNRCLEIMKAKYGEGYYRLSEVYFGYGIFLSETGRTAQALEAHKNALKICLENYGEKHPLVAISYEQLGDYYLGLLKYPEALDNYQKSLIAVCPGYYNDAIFSNPSITSSLYNIRLLDILKKKAGALELYAKASREKSERITLLKASLETNDLAIRLIDVIRSSYTTEESRMYLAENEKETYLSGVRTAGAIYRITGDKAIVNKMYGIVQKAKASVLTNDMSERELYRAAGIPDSILQRHTRLSQNISAWSMLIQNEMKEPMPDRMKLQRWKDDLFVMNRGLEKLTAKINSDHPGLTGALLKAQPVTVSNLQRHLRRDETIIDYLISDRDNRGNRDLYVFIIKKKELAFREINLDSTFSINTGIAYNGCRDPHYGNFGEFTGALAYLYVWLIQPVEDLFAGDKLIIIPDEEIGLVPFDALLTGRPGPEKQDYEGLPYLVQSYSISYCYSSSLLTAPGLPSLTGQKVYSFVPHYAGISNSDSGRVSLMGTGIETNSIYQWFKGGIYEGSGATETNFRLAMRKPAIFHFAMHSITDTSDSRYSYLLFEPDSDKAQDGRLYYFEISGSRIKSPMVVLSACNSGSGNLYHGEGLISLARGFILAGASSVIKTSWEINDEISADIVTRFYRSLSEGESKDRALQGAMRGYLKDSPPVYSNPYYWAAYEVLGSNAPVRKSFRREGSILAGLTLIACLIMFVIYLKRRRIF